LVDVAVAVNQEGDEVEFSVAEGAELFRLRALRHDAKPQSRGGTEAAQRPNGAKPKGDEIIRASGDAEKQNAPRLLFCRFGAYRGCSAINELDLVNQRFRGLLLGVKARTELSNP
jgi:hypothetical protein